MYLSKPWGEVKKALVNRKRCEKRGKEMCQKAHLGVPKVNQLLKMHHWMASNLHMSAIVCVHWLKFHDLSGNKHSCQYSNRQQG